ncbi:MAG: hypothetical protein U0984_02705 [Prosthecobacter sp.]|nr:hypothetical protein [Prosthecobacter sp.]
MLPNPLAAVQNPGRCLAVLALWSGAFAVALALIFHGKIALLELAKNAAHANEIVKGFAGQGNPIWQLYADFGFIVCYATLLAFCCFRAAVLASAAGWRTLATVSVALGWCQWLAGGLDAVENVALLQFLNGVSGDAAIAVSHWCAGIRFVLACLGCLVAGYVFLRARGSVSRRTEVVLAWLLICAGLYFLWILRAGLTAWPPG